jgi:hypothetical protein
MEFRTVIKPEEDFETFGAGSLRADQRHWRLLEDDDVRSEDKAADFDENELLDGGSTCAHCGVVIARDEPVRRTAAGTFTHETCPDSADPT